VLILCRGLHANDEHAVRVGFQTLVLRRAPDPVFVPQLSDPGSVVPVWPSRDELFHSVDVAVEAQRAPMSLLAFRWLLLQTTMLPIATTLLATLDVGVRIDVGLCVGTVRARVGLVVVELQLLSCSWTLTRPTRRTRVCTVCVCARACACAVGGYVVRVRDCVRARVCACVCVCVCVCVCASSPAAFLLWWLVLLRRFGDVRTFAHVA